MTEESVAGPTVILAPDKFKGSLTAEEASDVLARAINSISPHCRILRHPVADGGEGTVKLALANGFSPVAVQVTGPLGQPVEATYAMNGAGTAVLELAEASGLALLPGKPDVQTAGKSTTRGVGEMLKDALDREVRRIILGVGGSASTDGGAGLAQALGVRITDAAGMEIAPGGEGLHAAAQIDLSGLDPRVRAVDLILACDVDNPLTGEDGAAAVYGPQKGADARTVEELGRSLRHWARLVARTLGRDLSLVAGTGAAGGAAFAALAIAGARLCSGVEVLTELTTLGPALREADLVIVGEGSLDEQSLRGKGPVGIAALAKRHGTTVVAVVGRTTLGEAQIRTAGLDRVYALTDFEPMPEVCMREAPRLLGEAAEQIARDWLSGTTGVTL